MSGFSAFMGEFDKAGGCLHCLPPRRGRFRYQCIIIYESLLLVVRFINWQLTLEVSDFQSSHCGAVQTNPTRNDEVAGFIPGLAQWVKDLVLP